MGLRAFSHKRERAYYSQRWPEKAKPFLHLEPYFRCWLDPEAVFGGKRVLDIGAGECTQTRVIGVKFGPRQIVACELFLERMRPAARVNLCPKLAFVSGDTFALPFQNKSFDVVFASCVLSQIGNILNALLEIKRVLGDGGLYLGWEPNPFNAVISYRYFFKPRPPSQMLFWPWRIRPLFEQVGFDLKLSYFYAKCPYVRNRLVGTCMGIMAKPCAA